MTKKALRRLKMTVVGVLATVLIWNFVYKEPYIGYRKQKTIEQMGPGINLGNSLDVDNLHERKPDAKVTEYETYWGNPPITKELFFTIAKKGFGMVRIPVTWGEHMDEDGIVDPLWMERVKEVTQWAHEAGLYVILDTHHENWLVPTKEEEERVKDRFCLLWQQIADAFRQEGEYLLFEGMNEPRLQGSEEEWNGGSQETRQVVNRLNRAFVETIRKSGGHNTDRWLMVSPYGCSYEKEALEELVIPEDDRLIVSVHAYIPYAFTLDEDAGDSFDEYREETEERIAELMGDLKKLYIRKGIPVMITEFGCHEKPDDRERLEWMKVYLKKAGEKNIPCIWWDNGKDSKIIDRENCVWTKEELTELLLGNGKDGNGNG